MKKIAKLAESDNFSAVTIGPMDELSEYSMIHPKSGQQITGKIFLKEAMEATGTEISFNSLPPHTDLSYFHIHHEVEETYIFLSGHGDFQVDDDCFPIGEGSVVRIAPAGKRGFRNSSGEPMIYIVIQSKAGSLERFSSGDGERIPCEPLWLKEK